MNLRTTKVTMDTTKARSTSLRVATIILKRTVFGSRGVEESPMVSSGVLLHIDSFRCLQQIPYRQPESFDAICLFQ